MMICLPRVCKQRPLCRCPERGGVQVRKPIRGAVRFHRGWRAQLRTSEKVPRSLCRVVLQLSVDRRSGAQRREGSVEQRSLLHTFVRTRLFDQITSFLTFGTFATAISRKEERKVSAASKPIFPTKYVFVFQSFRKS